MTEKCQARRMPGTRAPNVKQSKDIMLAEKAQGIKTYQREFLFIRCGRRHTWEQEAGRQRCATHFTR
jgi:hypothetical protein